MRPCGTVLYGERRHGENGRVTYNVKKNAMRCDVTARAARERPPTHFHSERESRIPRQKKSTDCTRAHEGATTKADGAARSRRMRGQLVFLAFLAFLTSVAFWASSSSVAFIALCSNLCAIYFMAMSSGAKVKSLLRGRISVAT